MLPPCLIGDGSAPLCSTKRPREIACFEIASLSASVAKEGTCKEGHMQGKAHAREGSCTSVRHLMSTLQRDWSRGEETSRCGCGGVVHEKQGLLWSVEDLEGKGTMLFGGQDAQ